MRRTNFLQSGNFTIPDIMGTNFGTVGDSPGITPWSIQASMLSNFERLSLALKATAPKGRLLSYSDIVVSPGGDSVTVPPLVGISKLGNLIWIRKSLTLPLVVGSEYDIWAEFKVVPVPDTEPYGRTVSRTGVFGNPTEQIVHDESGAADENISASDILTTAEPGDGLFIGTAFTDPVGIKMNPDVGFYNTDGSGNLLVPAIKSNFLECENLTCNQESFFTQQINSDGGIAVYNNQTIEVKAGSAFQADGVVGTTNTIDFQDMSGNNIHIEARAGIIVSLTKTP